MSYIVLGIGVLLLAFGGFLLWKKRKIGSIPILVGVAFVFLADAGGGTLASLKLTLSGFDVKFAAASPNKEEKEAVDRAALAGVSGVHWSSDDGAAPNTVSVQSLAPEFVNFYQSLGFLPTSIAGADILTPGSVIYFEGGRPILQASPDIAFPKLHVEIKDTVVPIVNFAVMANAAGSPISKRDVEFKCAGARVGFVSETGLTNAISKEYITTLGVDRTLFVVSKALTCQTLFVGVSDSRKSSGGIAQDETAASWEYRSDKPATVGFTMFRLERSR
jgi:hypothetical protein